MEYDIFNTFIETCDEIQIVNESNASFSATAIAAWNKLIITCRHLIYRAVLQLNTFKKIKIPKEIYNFAMELSSECTRIHANVIRDKEEYDFTTKLNELRKKQSYKVLFNGSEKIYDEKDMIIVEGSKIVRVLRALDKEFEMYEKELVNMERLMSSRFTYNEVSCSLIILSEYVKIQTQILKWKNESNVDGVDIGGEINITLDEPSF